MPQAFDPSALPEIDNNCVFCPGHEDFNLEVERVPKNSNWKVRAIPNKFEALGHTGGRARNDFYNVREGIGDHEVLITRPHNIITAFLSGDLMDANLKMYQDRMLDLSQHPEVQYVHVIQNHGRDGGASLTHPHSQIFATPFVPEHLHDEVVGAYHFFENNGACVWCEMILKELQDKERLVLDNEDYLVFCPFASRVPYALRIIPKTHQASFMDLNDRQRRSLGLVLTEALKKLFYHLNNPSYNYYIHTLPVTHSLHTRYDDRAYHWHLEILPRLNVWGGFELGSDCYINTVFPEQAADYLRQPYKK